MVGRYKGLERRRSPRVNAEFIVIYKVDRPIEVHMWIGNKEVNSVMLDLSGVGIAILTNYEIPVSTTLFITFTIVDLNTDKDERVRTIESVGEVRNSVLTASDEYRLGIAFTQISQQDKAAIERFVSSKSFQ